MVEAVSIALIKKRRRINERVVAHLWGSTTDLCIHLEEAGILYSLLRDCVSRPRELGRRGSVSSSLSLLSFSFWHITCWLRRVPPSCGHCVRSPPPCSDAGCACIVAILGCSLLPRVVCGVAPSATKPPWLACAGWPDPAIHHKPTADPRNSRLY